MTIADLKLALLLSHEMSVAHSGIDPAGMVEAINALPDTRLLRTVPMIPVDVFDWIVEQVEACDD